MPTAAQIEEWSEQLRVLRQELDMLESGKMGTGDKTLRGTTTESIARVKANIVQLDRLLSGKAPDA